MGDVIRYPNMGTVAKAAAIYGLPPTYIRTLCRTGKIRYVVAGHRWLVNLDSLAQYFERGDPVPAEQGEAVGGIRRVAR
ncbi:MAG: helix-turn-helix domain-containing protein [Faecalibacterium prausnitzii]|nr:helix-turn-helix domain-containing protein [Faecalibacterium prausnitzii]